MHNVALRYIKAVLQANVKEQILGFKYSCGYPAITPVVAISQSSHPVFCVWGGELHKKGHVWRVGVCQYFLHTFGEQLEFCWIGSYKSAPPLFRIFNKRRAHFRNRFSILFNVGKGEKEEGEGVEGGGADMGGNKKNWGEV